VEGFAAPDAPDLLPGDRVAAETWTREVVTAGRVNLMAGEPAARPAAGIVYMPAADAFDSLDSYLCTFWHELTHWTAPKVEREMTAKRFGDDAYAAEELVAEMGAAIIAARHGISAEPRPDHAHYLAHWLRVLKADPSRLWTAGKQAEKASAYLFDLVPLDGAEAEPEAEQAIAA
jgi:antirestriction protein ArdC